MSLDHTQGKPDTASTAAPDTRPTIGLTDEGFPIKDPEELARQLKARGQEVTAAEDSNPDDVASDPTPFVDPDAPKVDDGTTKIPTEQQPPLAQTDTEQDPQPKESEREPSGLNNGGLTKL